MIRFPLRKQIILITLGKYFVCQIIFAGRDILQCKEVYERIHTSEGYFDVFIGNDIFFDREIATGYAKLDDETPKIDKDTKIINFRRT